MPVLSQTSSTINGEIKTNRQIMYLSRSRTKNLDLWKIIKMYKNNCTKNAQYTVIRGAYSKSGINAKTEEIFAHKLK